MRTADGAWRQNFTNEIITMPLEGGFANIKHEIRMGVYDPESCCLVEGRRRYCLRSQSEFPDSCCPFPDCTLISSIAHLKHARNKKKL
jgi:hypothetical protein